MDGQGRLLIHPLLRKSAEVLGDVAVMGYLTYLEVWELDKFRLECWRILIRKRTRPQSQG
jgi:DNA-binding transcriptional regulator/RsmH inhibitor MraZ